MASKAKKREQPKSKRCERCGDGHDPDHLKRITILVDRKRRYSVRACRHCRGVIEVLLTDVRRR